MRCATLILAMALLIGTASIAAAECAWVLWEKHGFSRTGNGVDRVTWSLKGAYEDHAKCATSREDLLGWTAQLFRNLGGEVALQGKWRFDLRSVIKYERDQYTQIDGFNFYCLPGTISDPR